MGSFTPKLVTDAARAEGADVRFGFGGAYDETSTRVNRAAHTAARAVAAELSHEHSVAGMAQMLGVTVRSAFSDKNYRQGYVISDYTPEMRKQLDYGKLPARLIRDVLQLVAPLRSEETDNVAISRLAGRTMGVVYERPTISGHELRERLVEINSDPLRAPLLRGEQLPGEIARFGAVVQVSHFATLQYLEQRDQRIAQPSIVDFRGEL